MQNFNMLGIHWKNLTFILGGGWVHEKPIYRVDCLKGGAWAVRRFNGRPDKKEGVVFLKRLIP